MVPQFRDQATAADNNELAREMRQCRGHVVVTTLPKDGLLGIESRNAVSDFTYKVAISMKPSETMDLTGIKEVLKTLEAHPTATCSRVIPSTKTVKNPVAKPKPKKLNCALFHGKECCY